MADHDQQTHRTSASLTAGLLGSAITFGLKRKTMRMAFAANVLPVPRCQEYLIVTVDVPSLKLPRSLELYLYSIVADFIDSWKTMKLLFYP
jgi:hypothetical protein